MITMDKIFLKKKREKPNFDIMQFRSVFQDVKTYLITILNTHPKNAKEFVETSKKIKP